MDIWLEKYRIPKSPYVVCDCAVKYFTSNTFCTRCFLKKRKILSTECKKLVVLYPHMKTELEKWLQQLLHS